MNTYADEPLPPHDTAAEQALLGTALMWTAAAAVVAEAVPSVAFYSPFHAAVATSVAALLAAGQPIEVTTVAAHLATIGWPNQAPALLELGSHAGGPSTAGAMKIAETILDCWARRQALAALRSAEAMAYDRKAPLGDLAQTAMRAAEAAAMPLQRREPSIDIDAFLAVEDADPTWVIPGVLERQDRLILTSGEGSGKSTLLRQVAVQCAAGMHPFTGRAMPPQRSLIIDFENGDKQLRRSIRPMVREVRRQQFTVDRSHLRIEVRLAGVDLTRDADARWLYSVVEANRPDLICTGPLYKMGGTASKEDEASKVARVLDNVRTRYDTCLLLETHSPHGDDDEDSARPRPLRPIGSSLWLRWPEFGYGIRPERGQEGSKRRWLWQPWRGAREVRAWPKALRKFSGELPWTVDLVDQWQP